MMLGQTRKKRILIVGLPLFAQRLQKELQSFDTKNKYFFLDTYYTKKDRIKALFLIPFCDVVYSINGSLSKSGVFDLTLKLKKRLMLTWVGTDVTKAKKESNKNQNYLNHAEHYCEVNWIKEELKELGINATIQNFFNFPREIKQAEFPLSKQLHILTYMGKNREEYYGWNEILEVAKLNPEVQISVVGTDGISETPDNMKCLGWQQDMNTHFNQAHCVIRFIEHDGLSGFVLESLLRGKQVIYNQKLEYCLHAKNSDDMNAFIQSLQYKLKKNESLFNNEGKEFVLNQFNTNTILSTLVKNFEK
jgi:hypothetical protein